MPTKVQQYSNLAKTTREGLVQNAESWTSFLVAASRQYKYSFSEQLMIYAQRPDASACATMELWNDMMYRWVRKGSRGIALIDESSNTPKLKYVFDIQDTEDGRYRTRTPNLWAFKEEHKNPVMSALVQTFGSFSNDLPTQIINVAESLAEEYYLDVGDELRYALDESALDNLEPEDVELAFRDTLAASIAYSTLARCGQDVSTVDTELFSKINLFNTDAAISLIGTAASDLSQQLLRQIERTIKTHEREKIKENEHERFDIQPEWGLSDPQPGTERTTERGDREIRHDAQNFFEREPEVAVQPDVDGRNLVQPPAGSGQAGNGTTGIDHEQPDGERPGTGQSQRSGGVGATHEQPETQSGGKHTGRTDLQPQIEETPKPDSQTLSGFLTQSQSGISEKEVDAFLQSGTNEKDGKLNIAITFSKNKSNQENIDYLKKQYRTGGKGLEVDGQKIATWFDGAGLHMAKDTSALRSDKAILIPWEMVNSRIKENLMQGSYIFADEWERADYYERNSIAERLWYVYRDEYKIPEKWNENGSGFPDATATITNLLKTDPESIVIQIKEDIAAIQSGEKQSRFGDSNTKKVEMVLRHVEELSLPRLSYSPKDDVVVINPAFITEDEIDREINRRDGFDEGKYRIAQFFLEEHTSKEKAKFLKDIYGTGGHSSSSLNDDEWHDSKGIRLRSGWGGEIYAEKMLSWPNVVKRIELLIKENRYLNSEQLERVPEYERLVLAKQVNSLLVKHPEDSPWEFAFQYDSSVNQLVSDFLEKPEKVNELLVFLKSQHEQGNLSSIEELVYQDVASFQEGTYSLFPRLNAIKASEIQTATVKDSEKPEKELPPTKPGKKNTIKKENPDGQEQQQLSLFPSEAEQRETIAEKRQAVLIPLTEADIDFAIKNCTADKSKVQKQIQKSPRSLETAKLIKEEYQKYVTGVSLPNGLDASLQVNRQGFLIDPMGGQEMTIPWANFQKRLIDMVQAGNYLSESEKDSLTAEGGKDTQPPISGNEIEQEKIPNVENVPETPDHTFSIPIEGFPTLTRDDVFHMGKTENGKEHRLLDIKGQLYILENLENEKMRTTEQGLFRTAFEKNANNAHFYEEQNLPYPQRMLAENAELREKQAVDSKETDIPDVVQANNEDLIEQAVEFEDVKKEEINKTGTSNYRITDEDLGNYSAKTRFKQNIEAIHTLKAIEQENRSAAPEEQEVLAKYTGWGAIPQAFDAGNNKWAKEYGELKNNLSDEEYSAARASTLNAHFTSPTIIKAMYEALEKTGFSKGNILEPACGVGNFLGLVPASMQQAQLYGVELDSITGKIAKQLYPDAKINITGFEQTKYPDEFFDVAISNVPFGQYPVTDLHDKALNKENFHIHDFFFAKALEKVKPGGIIAFITSQGTLDKADSTVRHYIAERADLMGAVRLPDNAFLKNAGTEVTSDIIFLQKREKAIEITEENEPEWIKLSEIEDGIPVNRYFSENPQQILGKMAWGNKMYGNAKDTTCRPLENTTLKEQLKTAFSFMDDQAIPTIGEKQTRQIEQKNLFLPDPEPFKSLPVAEDNNIMPLFSFFEVHAGQEYFYIDDFDGERRRHTVTAAQEGLYYRESSHISQVELPKKDQERLLGLLALREATNDLIQSQLLDLPEVHIQNAQHGLNALYDRFVKKYGRINDKANEKIFSTDPAYYRLCALEIMDDDGKFERKADILHKRTINAHVVAQSADTANEALTLSINEKGHIDMNYMMELTGFTKEKIASDLQGVIFRIPQISQDGNSIYETANNYLSGNVREKLLLAKQATVWDSEFQFNVEMLEKVQPEPIEASDISVHLSSAWIPQEYMQQFVFETLETPANAQRNMKVLYSPDSGRWKIENKSIIPLNDVNAYVKYGTDTISAYYLIEKTLNLSDVKIYKTVKDAEGKEHRVVDEKATIVAQEKQDALDRAFQAWVFKDPQRREALVKQYNEEFNVYRECEYDGSHLVFPGMDKNIKLYEHQRNAVARILYSGNTLLAHGVGTGKTFEMVTAAMELKRLGLANKSMFTVPKHLVGQWAGEFYRAYPNANILVASAKDFEASNRKKFCSRIATGDFDAVIVSYEQFEKIPISKERQVDLLENQIKELTKGIAELKAAKGERYSIKQMELTRNSLAEKLAKLNTQEHKDNAITFEELGVDRLFVDEAHSYKNLFLHTKIQGVAGVPNSLVQKSNDMFLKCQYLDEITNHKGLIFATATPISNALPELYTMMRYLQYRTLDAMRHLHFDSWASTFCEVTRSLELAPEGNGFRVRKRLAKLLNAPEILSIFRQAADIVTSDMLDLPVPKVEYEVIETKPTEHQKMLMQTLSDRASAIQNRQVDRKKDNMLLITGDGKKIALDQRLVNPQLPDDPKSKVNACVGNVFDVWKTTEKDHSTQLIFCDMSTPKKLTKKIKDAMKNVAGKVKAAITGEDFIPFQETQTSFNVYDDIRDKLVAKGIPHKEIAFIHEAETEKQKKELFANVRSGKVRVLLGSTAKMGTGMNVQDRLIAMHDLDVPWRPSDLEQRKGRIERQGNLNNVVKVFRYITENTFDAYLWQTIETKQKFISQIMSGKITARVVELFDDAALKFAEIKALCIGDPILREMANLQTEIPKLQVLQKEHQREQYQLQDQLYKHLPSSIKACEENICGFKSDLALYQENKAAENQKDKFQISVSGKHFDNKEQARQAILSACKKLSAKDATIPVPIGSYKGFRLDAKLDSYGQYHISLKNAMRHSCELGSDPIGMITRLNNLLKDIPETIAQQQDKLENLHQQATNAKKELGVPFLHELDLAQKQKRLGTLKVELEKKNKNKEAGQDKTTIEKPSILAQLKNKDGSLSTEKSVNEKTQKQGIAL